MKKFHAMGEKGLGSALVAVLVAGLVFVSGASAAMKFSYGPVRYEIQSLYCILQTQETMVGGALGAQMNVKRRLPKVGQVFYVRIFANNPGIKCGGEWTYADIALPPGVRPAVSRKKPVRCYFRGSGKWIRLKTAKDGTCGRKLGPKAVNHPKLRRWFGMNQVSGDVWPIPQGSEYRFDLPVKASRAISPRNSCACAVGAFVTSSGVSMPESSWSFSRKLFPSRGPYGPLRVFPR